MKMTYEKIDPEARTPDKPNETDACWDLYSVEDCWIWPFTTRAIHTGLKIDVPQYHKLHICSRSGLAAKNTICVFNAPGVIDSGYVGEIRVILYNGGIFPFKIRVGMKIAQFCRELSWPDTIEEGPVDMNTLRGENGLGSSGL